MIPGSANALLLGSAAGGYEIERSLRFNSADSAYLSRTPASAGNRKTWTWAGWVKRSAFGAQGMLMDNGNATTISTDFGFDTDNTIYWTNYNGGYQNRVRTLAVFRDSSAWYHVVFACDTTQATDTNRIKIYVNGTLQSLTSVNGYPTQNFDTYANSTSYGATIGARSGGSFGFNGYLADIHFIDGQALDPTSFGKFDANGIWQPIEYTGTYPGNSFHLDFSDNSAATAAALGADSSGNGNNWTPNNLSVTAGAGNDSLVDVPTNGSEVDTGVGGQVRGNYCTWNPLNNPASVTLTNGNLDANAPIDTAVTANIAIPESTKIYFEFYITQRGGGGAQSPLVGICTPAQNLNANTGAGGSSVWLQQADGNKSGGGGGPTAYGSSFAAGDIIGVAVDRANSRIWFSKNGTWQNSGTPTNGSDSNAAFTNVPPTGTIYIVYGNNNTIPGYGSLNAGQRPFAYTAPSGFKALCTANLPTGTITTSGTFTGNANADGPFVYLNGVPTAMTINGNAVTFATHADKLSNGFKLRTSSGSYNTAGSNTYSVTTTGDNFKNARAQSNP